MHCFEINSIIQKPDKNVVAVGNGSPIVFRRRVTAGATSSSRNQTRVPKKLKLNKGLCKIEKCSVFTAVGEH